MQTSPDKPTRTRRVTFNVCIILLAASGLFAYTLSRQARANQNQIAQMRQEYQAVLNDCNNQFNRWQVISTRLSLIEIKIRNHQQAFGTPLTTAAVDDLYEGGSLSQKTARRAFVYQYEVTEMRDSTIQRLEFYSEQLSELVKGKNPESIKQSIEEYEKQNPWPDWAHDLSQ